MESFKESETLLTNIQVEKVLICFLREVFNGDLGQIDQKGWDNFELLRVSPKARIRFGTDICIQMLHKANDNLKSKVKEKDQHITHSLRSPSSGKLPLLHLDYVSPGNFSQFTISALEASSVTFIFQAASVTLVLRLVIP